MIKAAHFLRFSPNQTGIYATARDLILAERAQGIDAQAIDYGSTNYPKYHSRVGCKDGDLVTVSPDWARNADILVRHSLIPQEIEKLGKPVLLALHGTPEYTFRLEWVKKTNVLQEAIASAKKSTVLLTFWQEHIFEWQTLLDNKQIYYCPPLVDLTQFSPEGKRVKFNKDKIIIVSTGIWRNEYHIPYPCIWAAAELAKENSKIEIHVFACPNDDRPNAPLKRMIVQMQKAGIKIYRYGLVTDIATVYRGASLSLTSHTVASRTVRESLACGCPVVAGFGNPYTPYSGNPSDREDFADAIKYCISDISLEQRKESRQIAEQEFNPVNAGKKMLEIFTDILS
jgi:glycosyltransferase involved in cell wall biosynthesis